MQNGDISSNKGNEQIVVLRVNGNETNAYELIGTSMAIPITYHTMAWPVMYFTG